MSEVVQLLSRALLQSDIRRGKEAGRSFSEEDPEFEFLTQALARSRTNFAQLAQDLWVLFELDDKQGGFFVEFGAGDGIRLSNTYLLERHYGWRGILAEPNPVFHPNLHRNRRAFISHDCVAAESGKPVVLLQTEDPHFSATKEYAFADFHADRRRSGVPINTKTISLHHLLQAANAPRRIDYLSLDTEGSEYDILAAFDFRSYDIALLTVEHNHSPRETDLDDLLRAHGFERRFRAMTDFDAWYVNTGIDRRRPPRNTLPERRPVGWLPRLLRWKIGPRSTKQLLPYHKD